MKLPRLWVSLRGMLASIVVVAVILKWALDRPYPLFLFASAGWYVAWSDGSMSVEMGPDPYWESGPRWANVVRFPDGRLRFYLTLRPIPFFVQSEGTEQLLAR